MTRQPQTFALTDKPGDRLRRPLLLLAVAASLGSALLPCAGAQSVTGQLLDANTKIPVAGATVQLLDASGRTCSKVR